MGGICKLRRPDGSEYTINVEYNQLDPLLRSTSAFAGGDAPDPGAPIRAPRSWALPCAMPRHLPAALPAGCCLLSAVCCLLRSSRDSRRKRDAPRRWQCAGLGCSIGAHDLDSLRDCRWAPASATHGCICSSLVWSCGRVAVWWCGVVVVWCGAMTRDGLLPVSGQHQLPGVCDASLPARPRLHGLPAQRPARSAPTQAPDAARKCGHGMCATDSNV